MSHVFILLRLRSPPSVRNVAHPNSLASTQVSHDSATCVRPITIGAAVRRPTCEWYDRTAWTQLGSSYLRRRNEERGGQTENKCGPTFKDVSLPVSTIPRPSPPQTLAAPLLSFSLKKASNALIRWKIE